MAACHSLNLPLASLSQLLKWNPFICHGLPLRVMQQQQHSRILLVPICRSGSRLPAPSLPWMGLSPVMRPGAARMLPVKSFASDAAEFGSVQSETRLLKRKARLDELCVEKYPQYSRTMIQSWILQGKVTVDGKAAFKAGTPVSRVSKINITAEVPKFVCRAGYKLEAAIDYFECDIKDKVALDAGLSTGGFTDCLLQRGAAFVYGVDVGYGQVADKIRLDRRVCVMERTNLRYLAELPQLVDLVTLDLAFISILLVMPAVLAVMKPNSTLITLIKPQFEASRSQVGGGGVVRDPEVHKEVVSKVISGVEACGFTCKGWIESPLKGAEGNIEFLACFTRRGACREEGPRFNAMHQLRAPLMIDLEILPGSSHLNVSYTFMKVQEKAVMRSTKFRPQPVLQPSAPGTCVITQPGGANPTSDRTQPVKLYPELRNEL